MSDDAVAEIDALMGELFSGELLGRVTLRLVQDPSHYRGLSKIRGDREAVRGYVSAMLGDAVARPEPVKERHFTEQEMLNYSRALFGSELMRLEKDGSIAPGASEGLKKLSPGVWMAAKQLEAKGRTLVLRNSKWAGGLLTLGLLGYEVSSDVRAYREGKIDKYQCAEKVTASTASTVGGVGGAAAAAALCAGAASGPVMVIAAIASSFVAAELADTAAREGFTWTFGTDKDRAVENAYRELGLPNGIKLDTVREAYVAVGNRWHPDKESGSYDKFLQVSAAYELLLSELAPPALPPAAPELAYES